MSGYLGTGTLCECVWVLQEPHDKQGFLTAILNPTWHLPKPCKLLEQTVPDCSRTTNFFFLI